MRVHSPLTSFVGRDEDVPLVLKNLRAARLVTLTGSGGVGKTRLATEASGRLEVAAWFVPLAPVTDPAEVAYAVLDTLGIREPVIARRATGPARARCTGWKDTGGYWSAVASSAGSSSADGLAWS